MGFIYKITNKLNNKIYIGKTINSIQYRWDQHVSAAFANKDKDEYNFLFDMVQKRKDAGYTIHNNLVDDAD